MLLDALKNHLSNFEQERSINAACNQNADIRLPLLKSSIGDRPVCLDSKFDAPNLWLLVTSVATEVTNMLERFEYEISKLKAKLKLFSMDPPVRSSEFSKRAEPFSLKIREIEYFVKSSISHIARRLADMQSPQ